MAICIQIPTAENEQKIRIIATIYIRIAVKFYDKINLFTAFSLVPKMVEGNKYKTWQ
jgi:hypothetical protein